MLNRLVLVLGLFVICPAPSVAVAADAVPPGILYTEPLESVLFRHADHTGKGAACHACHSGLFDMEALRVQKNTDFNMDSLYKGKYCGACHDGRKAFAADTQCARCHLGSGVPTPPKDAPAYPSLVPMGGKRQGAVFNHATHVKQGACRRCHPAVFKPKAGANRIRIADHGKDAYCFVCHDRKGKGAFAWNECSRCHRNAVPAPKGVIPFGRDGQAVAFRHETHRLQAGCKACHPKPFSYRKGTAKIDFNDHVQGRSCFACHDRKGGKAFAWGECNLCHRNAVPAPRGAIDFGKDSKTGAVAFRHDSHRPPAGCKACHPGIFAYGNGAAKIGFIDHMKGKSCFVCHAQKNGTAFYDCNRCHKKEAPR
jgi:c(7)-type cytochrome triheme protein